MNKKYLFTIIGLLIIGIAIIFFIFIPNNFSCDNLEEEVHQLLEDANYCNVDSDCEINTEFWCPFGCYNLVNKNADLNQIRNLVAEYGENCPVCLYDCDRAPKQEEVQCKNSKCIDIRYE